jgi:hypothetical protein
MVTTRWTAGVLAALVLLAGCGGTSGPSGGPTTGATGTTPAPTAGTTGPRATSGTVVLTPADAVRRAALTRADLPAGFGANVQQQGDTVDGQVTLDLCGAHYPSEALRVARHQVRFPVSGTGSLGIGNEVVAYEPGGVAQAMSELRAAVKSCPTGFVPSTVQGVPPLRYDIRVLPTPSGLQPGTLRLHVVLSDPQGDSYDSTGTFQPHGRMLSILYFDTGAAGPAVMDRLCAELGRRLSAITVHAAPNA